MTRSNSAVTLVANERGLPDEPYFEAGGVYVAMLREPRARYLSQYLHLKQYGEAYLRVRAVAAVPALGLRALLTCVWLSFAPGRAPEVAGRAAAPGHHAARRRATAAGVARGCVKQRARACST